MASRLILAVQLLSLAFTAVGARAAELAFVEPVGSDRGRVALKPTAPGAAAKSTSTAVHCFLDPQQGQPACQLFGQGFEGADACSTIANNITDPDQRALFQPADFVGLLVPWAEAFNGFEYPDSWGAHYPVGSWTLANSPMTGTYISIPFTAESVTAETVYRHKLEWIPAVAIAQLGIYPPRPATGVMVTISSCAGDFRTSSAYSGPESDPTLRAACRMFDDTGTVFFGQYENISTCPLAAGQTFYLNIAFADPRDGMFNAWESTCDTRHPYYSPGICDAEFLLRN